VLRFFVIGETAALVVAVVTQHTHTQNPNEISYVLQTYVRIWGKYVYITTATTKAAVSPITTNLNTL
jgi:hypothetical protein